MGKTIIIVCAFNTVAAGAALFLLFRAPAKPPALPQQPSVEAVRATPQSQLAPPDAEALWQELTQAAGFQAAARAVANLPGEATFIERATAYVEAHPRQARGAADFAQNGRTAACILFLARHTRWDSAQNSLFQKIAKDRHASIIVRDIALRSVIDIALRKHAETKAPGSTWSAELSSFLHESDFGSESSMEGIALQAIAFAGNQGLIALDDDVLVERIRRILAAHATAHESTVIAALEASAKMNNRALADEVRSVVDNPKSEAIAQAAISALAKASVDDLKWMSAVPLQSAALYRTAETIWLNHSVPKAPYQ